MPSRTSPSSITRCWPARWNCCRSPGPRWRSSRSRSRYGVWHRQGTRGDARSGPHQGIHRCRRGRADFPVPGTIRPQAARRPARQGRGQDLRQDRRRGDRHGLLLRHHLCTWPGRAALLCGRTDDEHRAAARGFPEPARPRQTAADAVPAANSTKGRDARRRPGHGADARRRMYFS